MKSEKNIIIAFLLNLCFSIFEFFGGLFTGMDGFHNYATMHIVTNADSHEMKEKLREELGEHGVSHATFELELEGEHCHEPHCHVEAEPSKYHHDHHCH